MFWETRDPSSPHRQLYSLLNPISIRVTNELSTFLRLDKQRILVVPCAPPLLDNRSLDKSLLFLSCQQLLFPHVRLFPRC